MQFDDCHCVFGSHDLVWLFSPNRTVVTNEDINIENQLSITVVFPDSSLPDPSTGGFASQDEFRKFVTEKQKGGQWDSALHARPMAERLADYQDDAIAMAFPLQFPFGHTGLPQDPAVKKLALQNKFSFGSPMARMAEVAS